MARVAVFIDYQNTYHGARRAFGSTGAATDGQVDPLAVGRLVVDRGRVVDPGRALSIVKVFRGEPMEPFDPVGQSAAHRQISRWAGHQDVEPVSRPLRYRRVANRVVAEEKGIDVLVAIHLVMGALRDEYDVAVLFSADSDLVPAVEAVVDSGKRCELVAWEVAGRRRHRLVVPGRRVWCHWLDRGDYLAVADRTDYRRPTGGASG